MAQSLTYLFDADGVLQRSAGSWADGLGALLPAGADAAAFLQDFLSVERTFLDRTGDLAAAIAPVLERWGSQHSPSAALDVICRIDVDAAVLELVDELRADGHTCSLASNQNPVRAAHMSTDLRYAERFDRLYYSCDLGVAKPAPGFFRAVLDDLSTAAEQVVFIDDKQENSDAASAIGMHGVCYEMSAGVDDLRRRLGLE